MSVPTTGRHRGSTSTGLFVLNRSCLVVHDRVRFGCHLVRDLPLTTNGRSSLFPTVVDKTVLVHLETGRGPGRSTRPRGRDREAVSLWCPADVFWTPHPSCPTFSSRSGTSVLALEVQTLESPPSFVSGVRTPHRSRPYRLPGRMDLQVVHRGPEYEPDLKESDVMLVDGDPLKVLETIKTRLSHHFKH